MLRSISGDTNELKAILGEDYTRIVHLLSGKRETGTLNVAVVTSSAVALNRQPPPVAYRPAAQNTHRDPAGNSAPRSSPSPAANRSTVDSLLASATAQGPAQSQFDSGSGHGVGGIPQTRPAPAPSVSGHALEPPRKRRKRDYDSEDVIDLTSD